VTGMEKIFAIGDIHGSMDKLSAMLELLVIDWERDTLLFIGDYIDRGPQPFEVVERLVDLKRRHRGVIFLMGNHERMLLDYLAGGDRFTYFANGGFTTLEGYRRRFWAVDSLQIAPDHREFFESTVLYHETEDYIFVHAGMRPHIPLGRQAQSDLLWIREEFVRSDCDFGKRVVFGHTPFKEPLVMPNKIGIDTGAVYGNKLTCVELPALVFHQV
jgi:serine/threonine protein phosphatase 1